MAPITRRATLKFALLAPALLLLPSAARASRPAGLRFVLYKSGGGFRWRLKAANGKIVADSGEGYRTKAACRNTIELIQQEAAAAEIDDQT